METPASSVNTNTQQDYGARIYRVKNSRMGGTVPSWDAPKTNADGVNTAQTATQSTPRSALENGAARASQPIRDSYRAEAQAVEIAYKKPEEPFGFADVLDMVNPLQHIPLVNFAYREITGDEIKPIGMVVGGGLFGGPAGAASGVVNAVIKDATGDDVAGNAKRMAGLKTQPQQERSGYALEKAAYKDLSASLLAFTETPMPERYTMQMDDGADKAFAQDDDRSERRHNPSSPTQRSAYMSAASGRTAGSIPVYS